jgi:hypothetical protein
MFYIIIQVHAYKSQGLWPRLALFSLPVDFNNQMHPAAFCHIDASPLFHDIEIKGTKPMQSYDLGP